FSYVGQRNPVGVDGRRKPPDRLSHRLAAEAEGLVVNRDDEARAGLVGHLDGLLGRAVAAYPGVVRANRHGDDVHRAAMSDMAEARAGRVARNRDAVAAPFEEIPVEAAVDVLAHTRAPVTDAERFDLDALVRVLEPPSLAPTELDDLAEPQAAQQIARGLGR